jgi:hypothetical protein
MASSLTKEARGHVETSLAGYLRSEGSHYLSGGGAVQVNSSAVLGKIHRPTWDLDFITTNPGATRATYTISFPEKLFTVDFTGAASMSPQFTPIIMAVTDSNFLLMLQNKAKIEISFCGEVRYERLETVLANKAHVMVHKFSERKGEIGKDLFDIGVLASFTDPELLDRVKTDANYTTEMFHLSSSLVYFYPRSMAKRTSSDLPQSSIVDLSRIGRNRFSVSEERIRTLVHDHPAILPVMLLAAANEELKDRIPVIMRMPELCNGFARETNDAILASLRAGDTRRLDQTICSVIQKVRQLRQSL